ncbi:MAG TPA: DUF2059 domain-containing protein [Acidobacteriaceae bacterium]|jgi:hypothetical protein
MKRWLVLAVVFLTMSLAAHADEASKRAKAAQLMVAMNMERTMTDAMAAIRGQVNQAMQSMPGMGQTTPEQKKLIDNFQGQVNKLVDAATSWKVLEPQYVDLYAQIYTEQEIDGILAFYQSPAGKALVAKTPELTAKGMVISQRMMADLQPQINALLQQFLQQIDGLEHVAPSSKPAPAAHKN